MLNAYQVREMEQELHRKVSKKSYNKTLSEMERLIKEAVEYGRKEVKYVLGSKSLDGILKVKQELRKRGFIVSIRTEITSRYPNGTFVIKVHWKRRPLKNFLRDWILKRRDKKKELDRIRDMTRGY